MTIKAQAPQAGELWARPGRLMGEAERVHLQILRVDEGWAYIIGHGFDTGRVIRTEWPLSLILEGYTCLHTIEEAHAEALEHNALVTAPVADEVESAEDDARTALETPDAPWVAQVLDDYQEVMAEHGICLVIGCHVSTLTLHICRDHLTGATP